MGCAGTLSWSVMGLGWPAARSNSVTRTGTARVSSPVPPPRADEGPGAPSTRQASRASLSGAAVSAPTGPAGRLSGAPGGRVVEMQERGLEIDWSQVVRRAMDGDSGAWAELVRAHHKRVYGLCYRFTGQPADAEDLTQEVFLKVFTSLRSFDAGRGSLQIWITAMTRNLLVDNFRRTKNRRATSSLDDGWDESGALNPAERLKATGPSQHDVAAGRELEKMVQEALKRVPADLREAVILRDLQDMDYKEIAQVVGIPEGTVKSRISRGRAELARLLERTYREVM